MKTKNAIVNKLLSIILKNSHAMHEDIFKYYIETDKKQSSKVFYNLIAEAYISIYSYCLLIFNKCWSQAFAILRIAIEQIAIVIVVAKYEDGLNTFLKYRKLHDEYINIANDKERKEFLKSHDIPKNKVNDFFNYGFIVQFTKNNEYGRDQLLELASFEEFIIDIKNTLNAFSHGTLSIFQMNNENWDLLRKYVLRANLICCTGGADKNLDLIRKDKNV